MKPENPYKSLGRNLGTRVIDAWQEGFDAGIKYAIEKLKEELKQCNQEGLTLKPMNELLLTDFELRWADVPFDCEGCKKAIAQAQHNKTVKGIFGEMEPRIQNLMFTLPERSLREYMKWWQTFKKDKLGVENNEQIKR